MGCLPDKSLCSIAVKKLEGWSNREIAEQLDCSLRSVERKLAVIRGFWSDAVRGESAV
jgi:DNA-directed RNA polymerase specialized sigma24 family protein